MPREPSPAGRPYRNPEPMSAKLVIDPSWHPLVTGCPPEWASEWGQDRHGVFIAFTLGEVTQGLRWIPPGWFLMGSPADEAGRYDEEGPQHQVFITNGFWLFDTPCTQALWQAVMGENPSRFKSSQRPVEQVSWEDVQGFMQRINAHIPGLDLVLPTEAQWEHACRAGTDTALYTGPIEILGARNAPALDPIAWYGGNSGVGFELKEDHDSSDWPEMQYPNPRSGTHPVGEKQPNPWGLHDMIGNVWEWCADGLREYGEDYAIDPMGALNAGAARVLRGGSWYDYASLCRSAPRSGYQPDERSLIIGFRCARVQES